MSPPVSLVPSLPSLPSLLTVTPDARGSGDGFAPLIRELLAPDGLVPTCTLLPPGGEPLPAAAGAEPQPAGAPDEPLPTASGPPPAHPVAAAPPLALHDVLENARRPFAAPAPARFAPVLPAAEPAMSGAQPAERPTSAEEPVSPVATLLTAAVPPLARDSMASEQPAEGEPPKPQSDPSPPAAAAQPAKQPRTADSRRPETKRAWPDKAADTDLPPQLAPQVATESAGPAVTAAAMPTDPAPAPAPRPGAAAPSAETPVAPPAVASAAASRPQVAPPVPPLLASPDPGLEAKPHVRPGVPASPPDAPEPRPAAAAPSQPPVTPPSSRHPGLEPGSRFLPERPTMPAARAADAAPPLASKAAQDGETRPDGAPPRSVAVDAQPTIYPIEVSGIPAQGRGDEGETSAPAVGAARPSPPLASPLQATFRRRVGAAVPSRTAEVRAALPATRSDAQPPAPAAVAPPSLQAPALPAAIASAPALLPSRPLAPAISATVTATDAPPAPTSTRSAPVSDQQAGPGAREPETSPRTPVPPAPETAAPVILPALQAFGAAMRQTLAEERAPPRVEGEASLFAPAGLAPAPQPVAPSAPALDTADRRWPHAMAEHIERLRDAADEGSTRIRLLPDALGPVDVAVRRDGDVTHVHFTAAQAETRQLLLDAQPRLQDAAEARGLKLGRTDVSAGDAQTGERQPQRQPAPQPSRPAPARTAAVADAPDTRIA